MICPKCGAEYREGFYDCAECSVPLVTTNSTEDESPGDGFTDLVTVLETRDSNYLASLVSKMEEQQIPYLVQSGTAFSAESISEKRNLVWRAALLVPEYAEEKVQSLMNSIETESPANPQQPECDQD